MKTRPFLTTLWLAYHLLLGNLLLSLFLANRSEGSLLLPWETPFPFLAFSLPALALLLLAAHRASLRPLGWPAVVGWSLLCSAGIQTAGFFTFFVVPAVSADSGAGAAQAAVGGLLVATVTSGLMAIAVWPYILFFLVNVFYFRAVGRTKWNALRLR